MADCGPFDITCAASNLAQSAIGDAIDNMATAVMEATGKVVASLGTVWVNIGTPNLTGAGGSSSLPVGSTAPGSENLTTILGYVMWIALAICVMSLVGLGATLAIRHRSGEGVAVIGRVGIVLGAVVLISGASALVAGLMPTTPTNAGGAVAFLQSGLWWYTAAAAVLSVIIGGIRMAWEQRAEPGKETLKSLLTLIVVAGAGVTIVGLLVAAADAFSNWIISASLQCDVTSASSTCFGQNMLSLLALTTNPAAGGLGSLLIIILGIIAILATVFQIALMVARGGMLVVLTGILPLSASFTNTEMGKMWFRRNIAWLAAFILYKPAAAMIYAVAFQLAGANIFRDDGSGLLAVLTGLMLMIIALFAMPALMRFVTPMVGSLAGGAGSTLAVGAMAALPTGAASLGRLGSGSDGSPGAQGPSGSSSVSSAARMSPAPSGGTTAAGGAAGGGVAVSSGGAATSGVAAGGGTAAAGAAAGPVGIAAGAALGAGKAAGQAVAGAARSLGEQSTGEGGGPDGSR